jgi:small subunit ribosomal protein S20
MANTRSASKRARQTTQRSLRNRSVLTRLRGMQKSISAAGATPEAKNVHAMISAIDKAAKRGIIHKNAAKRRKARLNKSLGAASSSSAS